ncbi:MAG: hypothetical protein MK081_16235 [Flavobacteriales bacterium]|nr:hypothetical protein [Flavobacteriales bacterium]
MTIRDFKEYISDLVGFEVEAGTIFFDDLGLDELDIEILLLKIASDFNVDFTGFDYRDFRPRNFELLTGRRHKVFDLNHLFDVVKSGKWSNPN